MKPLLLFLIFVVSLTAEPIPKAIQQTLTRYCLDCHDAESQKGELDLERFSTTADIAADAGVWENVLHQLANAEMPPKKKAQPSAAEHREFSRWVQSTLDDIALANAGDPGPVVLRRLSNMEYTYTLRDLTGLDQLDPAGEFPVDGAAGEGFCNVGAGLVMSPALLGKYLDAAKGVAAHAVLMPDGLRFSEHTSRRDWTDEHLKAIRAFYDRFTENKDVPLQVSGAGKVPNRGGAIPLERYFAATLDLRVSDNKAPAELARERGLSPVYLERLWRQLNASDNSPLLNALRDKWRATEPRQAGELAAWTRQVQSSLWRFQSVGQLGEGGKQKQWMVPKSPLVTSQALQVALPDKITGEEVMLHLSAAGFGTGTHADIVKLKRPRLEFKDKARVPILVRDLPRLAEQMEDTIRVELRRTTRYLDALAHAHRKDQDLETVAAERGLNATLLQHWSELLALGQSRRELTGHYKKSARKIHNWDALNGWGHGTPSMLTNRAENDIRYLTITAPPRSVITHPSPDRDALIVWRSPIKAAVRVRGLVADVDGVCGNGAGWRVELRSRGGVQTLAKGSFDNGGQSEFAVEKPVTLESGDLVAVVVNARDRNHVCDSTRVGLTLTEQGGEDRTWDLEQNIIDNILDGNPLPDTHGNDAVWHFVSTPSQPAKETAPALEPGSSLATWRRAVVDGEKSTALEALAQAVQNDAGLQTKLADWRGPLRWSQILASKNQADSGDPDLVVHAAQPTQIRIPATFASGASFVCTAELQSGDSVQVTALSPSKRAAFDPSQPILVRSDSPGHRRMQESIETFRALFPAALCYRSIVPVDEVVTMTLFFREDEPLQRLMLTETEREELDRLWDELLFVAQEPIALVAAFDQIYQYATQDRPDNVVKFEPMRKPIYQRAETFRQRLRETESVHLDAVVDLAERAWRRPLAPAERTKLKALYQVLREQDLPHDDALRQMLARVLVAPDFLYRGEAALDGAQAAPVSDLELATRLSYFLWSSMPDETLRAAAAAGELRDPDKLAAQARRMLADPRVRRLATEFGAQWLHVRDIDQLDEKSERHFPEFAGLRSDMQEEVVRYFIDLFQHDRSILSLIDADHSFVNASLAKHYDLTVKKPGWQRVDGLKKQSRGGMLGFAATLAKHSGASRTSPILRGTWISETILGEKLPKPPKDVPVLPEEAPEGLSERQLIERHSSDPACARCHAKIDPFGFALEGFDAIGRARNAGDTKAPIDTKAALVDGTTFEGVEGLRRYLVETRGEDVERQFCRKLLGYALGRSVQLSDKPLLDAMLVRLGNEEHRVGVVVEMIVRSPQFRYVRGSGSASNPPSPKLEPEP